MMERLHSGMQLVMATLTSSGGGSHLEGRWISGNRDIRKTDAIGVAKRLGKTEVVTLLERFKSDAVQTRHAMRVELGWYDEAAAEMFALVVFVSDGLLQINDTTPSPAARFFNIARQLPLELQMVLCHRVVGSAKDIIPGKWPSSHWQRGWCGPHSSQTRHQADLTPSLSVTPPRPIVILTSLFLGAPSILSSFLFF